MFGPARAFSGTDHRCGVSRRLFLTGLVVALLFPSQGCKDDDDDDGFGGSALSIGLSVTPPSPGTTDVVSFVENAAGGGLLLVDVRAEDISSMFDGYDVEILFDPLVAEATNLVDGTLLDICGGLQPLKANNVANGNANATGTILFSAVLPGAAPPGCTLAGPDILATIAFRTVNQGSSALVFVAFNGDPNSPTGSRFFRTQPSVPSVPVTFMDGMAEIEVTR